MSGLVGKILSTLGLRSVRQAGAQGPKIGDEAG